MPTCDRSGSDVGRIGGRTGSTSARRSRASLVTTVERQSPLLRPPWLGAHRSMQRTDAAVVQHTRGQTRLPLNDRVSLPSPANPFGANRIRSQSENVPPGETTQLPELFEGIEHVEPRAPKVSVVSCRDRQPVASRGRGDVAVLDGHMLAGLIEQSFLLCPDVSD
jgi:hypothetical protein